MWNIKWTQPPYGDGITLYDKGFTPLSRKKRRYLNKIASRIIDHLLVVGHIMESQLIM